MKYSVVHSTMKETQLLQVLKITHAKYGRIQWQWIRDQVKLQKLLQLKQKPNRSLRNRLNRSKYHNNNNKNKKTIKMIIANNKNYNCSKSSSSKSKSSCSCSSSSSNSNSKRCKRCNSHNNQSLYLYSNNKNPWLKKNKSQCYMLNNNRCRNNNLIYKKKIKNNPY